MIKKTEVQLRFRFRNVSLTKKRLCFIAFDFNRKEGKYNSLFCIKDCKNILKC